MKNGYTLTEILVVIAVTGIILLFVINSFLNLIKIQALDSDYVSVASLIDQAKSLSINSKSGYKYGVYFATSTVILFKGEAYSASTTDQVYNLNGRVNISDINLVGGGLNQITFDRLNGYASASGTIGFSLKDGSAVPKIIQIYNTGVVEYK